jgi:hypothetical protein
MGPRQSAYVRSVRPSVLRRSDHVCDVHKDICAVTRNMTIYDSQDGCVHFHGMHGTVDAALL